MDIIGSNYIEVDAIVESFKPFIYIATMSLAYPYVRQDASLHLTDVYKVINVFSVNNNSFQR